MIFCCCCVGSNEHLKKAKKIRRQDASVQTKGNGCLYNLLYIHKV